MPKTKITNVSVSAFLNAVEDVQKRKDSKEVLKMMKRITGKSAKMWGGNIVGFGTYQYESASGRSGEWPITGFSPRKTSLTLYIMAGFKHYPELMEKLGKYKTGKSCLYIKKLDDVNREALEELVRESVNNMNKKYNS